MQIGKAGPPVTHISQAYEDRVEVRGRDLCGEVMGRLSFTEYFHLLLTGKDATDEQRFFLDLLLVAIAEHGMMPTNVGARMTLAADPGSLQGAVAAGILGCGPGDPRNGRAVCGRPRAGTAARARRRGAGLGGARDRVVNPRRRREGSRIWPPAPPARGSPSRTDPRARRRPCGEWASRHAGPGLPRRCGRSLGQAAHHERLDADRGGHARSRLPCLGRESGPDSCPYRRPARASGGGAPPTHRVPDGGGSRGGDCLRA